MIDRFSCKFTCAAFTEEKLRRTFVAVEIASKEGNSSLSLSLSLSHTHTHTISQNFYFYFLQKELKRNAHVLVEHMQGKKKKTKITLHFIIKYLQINFIIINKILAFFFFFFLIFCLKVDISVCNMDDNDVIDD